MAVTVFLLFLRKYWFHLLMAAAVVMVLWWAYAAGKESVRRDCEADKVKLERQIAALQKKQSEVTTKVETVYLDRVTTVKEKGDVIVKQVPVYIPADSCALPAGYRILHDAAAKGIVPDSIDGIDG